MVDQYLFIFAIGLTKINIGRHHFWLRNPNVFRWFIPSTDEGQANNMTEMLDD